MFFPVKMHFFGNKTFDQRFGANNKTILFHMLKMLNKSIILCSLVRVTISALKNVKAYFDQRLDCAAPKRWLKYTTEGNRERR